MDLIPTLAAQLGVDPAQAQAIAGAVLGQVQQQVDAHADGPSGADLAARIPELAAWKAQAASALGGAAPAGGSLLGGLAGALGGGVGNDLVEAFAGKDAAQQAQLVALVGKLGVGPEKAALVAPTILGFLRERLGDATLEQVLAIAPVLAGASGGAGSGGLGGLVSGLFGGR